MGSETGAEEKLITIDSLLAAHKQPCRVVLMAGGDRFQLRPLTEHKPKPMLDAGRRPTLETIVRRLADSGFPEFQI